MVHGTFQFLEYDIRPRHNRSGHSGQFGDMDAEAMFRSTTFHLAQEDDFSIDLLDADIEVLDAGE